MCSIALLWTRIARAMSACIPSLLRPCRWQSMCLGAALMVSASVIGAQPMIWVATSADLLQIHATSHQVLLRLPLAARELAADSDGGVWLATGTELLHLDRLGRTVAKLPYGTLTAGIAGIGTNQFDEPQLAADSGGGGVWTVRSSSGPVESAGGLYQSVLAHISADGRLSAQRLIAAESGQSLALSPQGQVLTMDSARLRRFSAQGELVASQLFANRLTDRRTAIGYDALASMLWYAGYTYRGTALYRWQLSGAHAAQEQSAQFDAYELAVDGPRGTVWALSAFELLQRSPVDGAQLVSSLCHPLWQNSHPYLGQSFEVTGYCAMNQPDAQWSALDLPVGDEPIGTQPEIMGRCPASMSGRKLAVDHSSGALWVGNCSTLQVFSAAGVWLASVELGRRVNVVSSTPFIAKPSLTLASPAAQALTHDVRPRFALDYGALCNGASCNLAANRLGPFALTAELDGTSIGSMFTLTPDGLHASYTPSLALAAGPHAFSASMRDALGQISNTVTSSLTIDATAPRLLTLSPPNESRLTASALMLQGTLDEPSVMTLDGVSQQGPQFSFPVTLQPGTNSLQLSATDPAGNVALFALRYHYLTIKFLEPAQNAGIGAAQVLVKGQFTAPADASVEVNGIAAQIDGGAFSAVVPLTLGSNQVVATLKSGGVSTSERLVLVRTSQGDQGGASLLAPPLDSTAPTTAFKATQFLYTGPNPVQTGVAPGTIEPRRAAVLRGRVLAPDGTPLPGVQMAVHRHVQYGQTLSRADGWFDMAVNGGGPLTLRYSKPGYLPVARVLQVPWGDYVVADDVVLTTLDTAVSPVELGPATPMQVARGSEVRDQDGVRRATLVFPAGTTAQLLMPDGQLRAQAQLHVRATEFTVGPSGEQAMPAQLEPSTAYTYAVELSADEAMAAGAKEVQFSKPVAVYVENFLGFPVGGIVPSGYYDSEKAAWMSSPNGRVVKLLDIAAGLAELDIDGDGQADSVAALTALGVSDQERGRLASLYATGQTLWRVPVTHFTAYDLNWPYPPLPDPPTIDTPPQPDDDDCQNYQTGSVISCQNQSLGESVAVAGAPWRLHYNSARTPGRLSQLLRIALSGPQGVDPRVRSIELEISVQGRRYSFSYPPLPNQRHVFEWDGRDVYGRRVQGASTVGIRVGYSAELPYALPVGLNPAFGAGPRSLNPLSLSPPRRVVTKWSSSQTTVGGMDTQRQRGIGGWNLDAMHAYDPTAKVLHLGNGERRSASVVAGQVIRRLLGPASEIAVAPNGDVFGVELRQDNDRLVKLDSAGGAAAVLSELPGQRKPYGVKVLGSGEVLLSSNEGLYYGLVERFGLSGERVRVAGCVDAECTADTELPNGVPATSYRMETATALALDSFQNIYVSDMQRAVIYKIDASGRISTFAGNGSMVQSGDGGSAREAGIGQCTGMTFDSAGNLYIACIDLGGFGGGTIRRITSDGQITRLVGGGDDASTEGLPALQVRLYAPWGLAFDARGNLLFTDILTNKLRKLAPDGTVSTVAGTGRVEPGMVLPGQFALQAAISEPRGVAIAPDGTIFVAAGLQESTPAMVIEGRSSGSLGVREFQLAADSGTEQYVFDADMRHLRTVSTRTGAVLARFDYADGLPLRLTDADGNVTSIERDGSGRATALVGPYGHRTELAYDPEGWLARIADPMGQTHQASYLPNGLMTRFENPRGHASEMQYDGAGRLVREDGPAGNSWTLSRSESATGLAVSMRSAEGRGYDYRIDRLASGVQRRTDTEPDGSRMVSDMRPDGVTEARLANGEVIARTATGDPRFGTQSPFYSTKTKLPSGLAQESSEQRHVILANPDDPLSLVSELSTFKLNGRSFTAEYVAATNSTRQTSAAGRVSTVRMDAVGRPLMVRPAGLAAIQYGYDSKGRLQTQSQGSGAEQRSLSYAYGPDGLVQRVTDALNQSVLYERDGVGRIIRSLLPGARSLALGYDANGNALSLQPPGRDAHAFEFSALDLETRYVPPPAPGVVNPATETSYNRDKDLTRIVWPGGVSADFAYTAGGKLSSIKPSAGAGAVISFGYAVSSGQLNEVSAPDAVLSLSYDGRLPVREQRAGSLPATLERQYDSDFRVRAIKLNGQVLTDFAYDPDSLLTRAGAMTITRDAATGLPVATALGTLSTVQQYNGFGEVSRVEVKFGGTNSLYSYTLAYDKLGRVQSKAETVEGATHNYEYGYDDAGRLASVKRDGASVASFGYDANGNRTMVNGAADAMFDAQDRMLTRDAVNYAYTPSGSLQERRSGAQLWRYDYDVYGNLRSVVLPSGGRVDYVMDGLNRRIGRKVNGVLVQGFVYEDGLRIAAELNGQGQVLSRFVYAERPNVPEYMDKGGQTYRLLTDHLGSVRLVVNANTGEVVQRMAYDEWGQVLSDSNPGFQPFGFAGGLYDPDTRLVRFGARDYDAEAGRWTAKDPIRFDGGDTNLYAYVGGNPISYVDLTGEAGVVPKNFGRDKPIGPISNPIAEAKAKEQATQNPMDFKCAIVNCDAEAAIKKNVICLASECVTNTGVRFRNDRNSCNVYDPKKTKCACILYGIAPGGASDSGRLPGL